MDQQKWTIQRILNGEIFLWVLKRHQPEFIGALDEKFYEEVSQCVI